MITLFFFDTLDLTLFEGNIFQQLRS